MLKRPTNKIEQKSYHQNNHHSPKMLGIVIIIIIMHTFSLTILQLINILNINHNVTFLIAHAFRDE